MLFDKIKMLFSRPEIPDETKGILSGATTTREILEGIDELLTRNELEFNEVNREIGKLEDIEVEEMDKVRSGNLPQRAKQNTLLYIKRIRKQMDNLQNRLNIFDKNINLHQNLIAKIQDMEAMQLRGVEESEIDEILLEFEGNFEKYTNTMLAGELAAESQSIMTSQEELELKKMEEEIMAGAPEPEVQEVEVKEEVSPPVEKVVEPTSTKEELVAESHDPRLDEEFELEEEEEPSKPTDEKRQLEAN